MSNLFVAIICKNFLKNRKCVGRSYYSNYQYLKILHRRDVIKPCKILHRLGIIYVCNSFHNCSNKISYNVLETIYAVDHTISRTCESKVIELTRRNTLGRIYHSFLYLFWKLWDLFQTGLRVFQLGFIFGPLIILYPLSLTSYHLKVCWYKFLLFGLEFAGPIFVKLGQWASTRRDLFSEELCSQLTKLQRTTKPHSWFYTKKTLERAFGPQWNQIFKKFDNNGDPIGSGCCAQVYKAWIMPEAFNSIIDLDISSECSENSFFVEGVEWMGLGWILSYRDKELKNVTDGCEITNFEPNETYQRSITGCHTDKNGLISVAVKVRHPRMETLLRRDLSIMRTCAWAITWMFPSIQWLSLVDCVDDFSQLMKAQVDLCVEASNLEKFAVNFRNIPAVRFPSPLTTLTKPYLLIETFEEGRPMQDYVISVIEQGQFNQKLAVLGINTIFKMVFEDNFAHGDLHPGNMLVEELESSTDTNSALRKLAFWLPPKAPSTQFRLVILDCGITASLDERGKICLKGVFAAVVDGDGEKVAELFLKHSNHQCKDVEAFTRRMSEIVDAALSKSVTLQEVEVSSLLTSLFSAVIDHKVKLDGSFSSIILAIMVLEGLGRSLDPTVDVIEKARPYLINVM